MESSPELIIINKFFKKNFPFVIEVSEITLLNGISTRRLTTSNLLEIRIYVSPTHFCELMDHRIESKVSDIIKLKSLSLLKSVFNYWDGGNIRILFYPEINEQTILKEISFI